MAFASGIFSRLYNWVTDRDASVKIRADRMDAEMDGFKDAFNEITAGTVQMIGAIKGYDGTVSLPGYAFFSDTNSGVYRIGADNVGLALGGVKHADFSTTGIALLEKGAPTSSGTDTITLTWPIVASALASEQRITFKAGGTNTGAATLNLNSLGAKAVRKISGGTDVAVAAGDITAGNYYQAIYDATANAAAGAWVLSGSASVSAATTSATGTVNLSHLTAPVNLGLAASVGSSALTIALKGVDGNDPSASNPVYVPFRNVTAATGTPSWLAITAATSIVISSGSTIGSPTGSVPFNGWIVGFNDGGTFRLGVILCTTVASGISTIYRLSQFGIASSTAEGGAGAADTAQTFYTGSAVTSKAYTVLGYFSYESGLATAGTWASVPTRLQLFGPGVLLPGQSMQPIENLTGAVATGTTTVPADDTIPQITEGTEFMTQAVTPSSAANVLQIDFQGYFANGTGTVQNIAALFQDATANALSAGVMTSVGIGLPSPIGVRHSMRAGTTSSTTFRVRAGPAAASTITFNGAAGARLYGGVFQSSLRITEIMA